MIHDSRLYNYQEFYARNVGFYSCLVVPETNISPNPFGCKSPTNYCASWTDRDKKILHGDY